jgi:putative endonuclease
MAHHNNIGKQGENLAHKWLIENGYSVLHVNWRHKHLEVDFIVSKNNILYFFEIKTRTSKKFGNPEESVTAKKMNNLKLAAEEYLIQNPNWQWIQFNVLSILIIESKIEYWLSEDVFF